MARNHSSPVTVLRPDPATGELVAVATAPASARKPAVVRQAAFGLWDDRVQAWAVGPVSLDGGDQHRVPARHV